jgi:hypothetical protein
LWRRIRDALPAGGRFSGQWYGTRDSWNGRPGMTFLDREEALALLAGFDAEMFEEEEADSTTPRGKPKHWHIFHIVARKLQEYSVRFRRRRMASQIAIAGTGP